MSLWEQYQAEYQKADTKTKQLLDSPVIPSCVSALDIEDAQRRLVIQKYTYFKLGITSKDDVVTALSEAGVSDADTTFTSVLTCIDTTEIPAPESDESLTTEAQTSPQPITSTTVKEQPVASAQTATNSATKVDVKPATIESLRQQVASFWSQYLSTTDESKRSEIKTNISKLAKQISDIQQKNPSVTPEDDPNAYWHELKTRTRATLPHTDEAALERIRKEYTDTPSEGYGAGETTSIISQIKGNAD